MAESILSVCHMNNHLLLNMATITSKKIACSHGHDDVREASLVRVLYRFLMEVHHFFSTQPPQDAIDSGAVHLNNTGNKDVEGGHGNGIIPVNDIGENSANVYKVSHSVGTQTRHVRIIDNNAAGVVGSQNQNQGSQAINPSFMGMTGVSSNSALSIDPRLAGNVGVQQTCGQSVSYNHPGLPAAQGNGAQVDAGNLAGTDNGTDKDVVMADNDNDSVTTYAGDGSHGGDAITANEGNVHDSAQPLAVHKCQGSSRQPAQHAVQSSTQQVATNSNQGSAGSPAMNTGRGPSRRRRDLPQQPTDGRTNDDLAREALGQAYTLFHQDAPHIVAKRNARAPGRPAVFTTCVLPSEGVVRP